MGCQGSKAAAPVKTSTGEATKSPEDANSIKANDALNNANKNCNNILIEDDKQKFQVCSESFFPASKLFYINGNNGDKTELQNEVITQNAMVQFKGDVQRSTNNENCLSNPSSVDVRASPHDDDEHQEASITIDDLPPDAYIEKLIMDTLNKHDNSYSEMLQEDAPFMIEAKGDRTAHVLCSSQMGSETSSQTTPEPTGDEGDAGAPFSCITNGNEIVRSLLSSQWNDSDDINEDSLIITRQLNPESASATDTNVDGNRSKSREKLQEVGENLEALKGDCN